MTTAPAVSRALKDAGFPIVQSRNNEGIRVSRGSLAGRVCVSVDLGQPGEADQQAEALTDWLNLHARGLGWIWHRHGEDLTLFTITGRPLPRPVGPKGEAVSLRTELSRSSYALTEAVEYGRAPAQADITAARTALEALIELAEEVK